MKILYLTDQFYLHGGVEKVLSQKVNYLADVLNDDVIVVTHNQNNNSPVYPFSEKVTFYDLNINYEIGKSYFHLKNLKKSIKHFKSLNNVLKKVNPDIIISSSIGPDFYFIPFVLKQVPKIKEFHSTRFFTSQNISFKKKILRKLSNYIEKKYDKLVILNEDERSFYPKNNIEIIPNPTDLNSKATKLKSNKIISAGRISYQKNFEDLISVAAIIKNKFPDWEFHIYGDDYLGRRNELQKRINSLGLNEYICFKGVTSNLKETFLDYSIYAMTSNHETFPMVLLEALSVGLPIVSYDCPTGPSRIITDKEDGYLIEYKNVNHFATKISKLIEDESLRIEMGQNAIINANKYSIEKVMQQWQELFNDLIV